MKKNQKKLKTSWEAMIFVKKLETNDLVIKDLTTGEIQIEKKPKPLVEKEWTKRV